MEEGLGVAAGGLETSFWASAPSTGDFENLLRGYSERTLGLHVSAPELAHSSVAAATAP